MSDPKGVEQDTRATFRLLCACKTQEHPVGVPPFRNQCSTEQEVPAPFRGDSF